MEVIQDSRIQNKQEFWQKHIRACENSCLSQREYCRRQSLALSTFGYWKRKIKRNSPEIPRFFPLTIPTVVSSESGTDICIAFYLNEDRFRIEVGEDFSPRLLRKLVTTLEQL